MSGWISPKLGAATLTLWLNITCWCVKRCGFNVFSSPAGAFGHEDMELLSDIPDQPTAAVLAAIDDSLKAGISAVKELVRLQTVRFIAKHTLLGSLACLCVAVNSPVLMETQAPPLINTNAGQHAVFEKD